LDNNQSKPPLFLANNQKINIMHKRLILLSYILSVSVCKAQQGAGIFAGPQITFFNPDNTVNFNKNYFRYNNTQPDIRAGIFGIINLRNDWYLNCDFSTGTKTFMFENYTIHFRDGSIDEGFAQTYSDYTVKVGVSKLINLKKLELYPFVFLSYTLNSYYGISFTDNGSISKDNDTLNYDPESKFNINDHYNSFGLGGGLTLRHKKILKRFALRIGYSYEFAFIPPSYYTIKAQQGSDAIDQSATMEGRFSFINFDVMFNILKSKGHKNPEI